MTTIREIFRTFGPDYVQRFGEDMPGEHRKVITAITACRTERCGMVVYECATCGRYHSVFRSCGNRHCPTCQNHKTKQWLETQIKRQLPGHHFMITFTVPEQVRRFIRSNQRIAYDAMFQASSQTLKKLTTDEKYIGGDLPGFFGVLHTWGRQLHYHPHIHYIVPGGALSKKDCSWHPSRIDFYLPVKAVSKIFRAKFHDHMKKHDLYDRIPSQVWEQDWNVHCQAVGSSEQSVKYLAPYVFKVAISDHRIVHVKDLNVSFRYRKPGSSRWRTTSLDVMEFLRRFLQHVLPAGFMKIRYYGFLNPHSSVTLETIGALIELSYAFEIAKPDPDIRAIPPLTCPHCGGILRYRESILPQTVPYADSS
jgi:hypothetical protein